MSPSPLVIVWGEGAGWEAGNGGRAWHAREKKDTGTVDPWLAAKEEGWESTIVQRHQPRREGAEQASLIRRKRQGRLL